MSRGAVAVGVLMVSFLVWLWRYTPETEDEVASWLETKGLANVRYHHHVRDIHTLKQLPSLDLDQLRGDLSSSTLSSLQSAVEELELRLWLEGQGLPEALPYLLHEGHSSMQSLLALDLQSATQLAGTMSSRKTGQQFLNSLHVLKSGQRRSAQGEEKEEESGSSIGSILWYVFTLVVVTVVIVVVVLAVVYVVGALVVNVVVTIAATIFLTIFVGILSAIFGGRRGGAPPPPPPRVPTLNIRPTVGGFVVFLAALVSGVAHAVWENVHSLFPRQPRPRPRTDSSSDPPEFQLGLLERIRGQYLDSQHCTLEWNHDDGAEVGGSTVATVHLICRNSTPYELQTSDTLKIIISHKTTNTVIPHVIEPAPPTGQSQFRLSFTTRLAGKYTVDVRVNSKKIAGSPHTRDYQPGPVDPAKTTFIDQTHWLVVTAGTYYSMLVAPRDTFGNPAHIIQDHLTLRIRKDGPEGVLVNPECVVERVSPSRFELLLKVEAPGHYVGCMLYKDQRIGPPSFTIISLSTSEEAAVDRNLSRKNLHIYYEATTAGDKGRQKKVYCYLYPKQLQVKEFYLKFIPYRLYTCKVCPSTNILLHPEAGTFTLDDGYQVPYTVHSPHREVIAATFYKFVLKNIGGSEQFKDKEQFFFTELKKHHSKHSRSEQRLVVNRFTLLESTMHATKSFSTSEWCRSFAVEFREEEALDWGGVSRELFQLLCVRCFDCTNGMFKRFKDSPQALVHPNHKHPSNITLKHYEFAGRVVGKCLYESAMGNRMLVTARFTRSFLAQIIGLRINHKYFESDDPDLYTTKIQYIKENDVTDLGLVFAEEEFNEGEPPKVVPLVDHGEEIEVTEQNKLQYLNLLAQYKLAKETKNEVEHFLKGLNDLIPDHLLSIFDENELELLICGLETVSYDDLKKHAVVSSSSNPAFRTVVSWFWIVISNFTQEEMARLLQFVTGCSQLPPGGFKELSPKFQITSAPTHGRLPTAHTCFNQLCLPDYDSCEQFQSALMMAINEGAEGFGFL